MVSKDPILPQRVRRVPRQFSWVDHRLVRDQYIDRCSHPAAALYLFLITVGDAKGMSYYGEKAIMQRLSMDIATLQKARDNLIRSDLIAWEKPLYQVLSLENHATPQRPSMAEPISLGELLRKAASGGVP
jgi:hypothetical protein